MVSYAGAPLLKNIEDDLIDCSCQEDGLVYYASFPDEGASTVTQAKFSHLSADDITLECSISGQSADSEWNFAELC